jgi:hypothetical protein
MTQQQDKLQIRTAHKFQYFKSNALGLLCPKIKPASIICDCYGLHRLLLTAGQFSLVISRKLKTQLLLYVLWENARVTCYF